jgi:hypothetical protein
MAVFSREKNNVQAFASTQVNQTEQVSCHIIKYEQCKQHVMDKI